MRSYDIETHKPTLNQIYEIAISDTIKHKLH